MTFIRIDQNQAAPCACEWNSPSEDASRRLDVLFTEELFTEKRPFIRPRR